MMKNIIFIPVIIFVSLTLAGQTNSGTLPDNSKDWSILESWSIPGQASGLAWDGTYFYFGIYGVDGDKVYKFDPSNGSSQLLFSSPDLEDSFGMTYDGNYLWITDHANSSLAYAMQFDFSGNIITQFDLPDQYMSGIAYDNGDFWVATYHPNPGTIYKLDNTGSIITQFQSPDEQPWDLCLENNNMWVVDYFADMIYKTDLTGNILESHPCETEQPSGIVFDGQYLWYVDGGQTTSKIYKVDLSGTGTPQISVPVTEYNYGIIAEGDSSVWYCDINSTGSVDLIVENLIIQNAVPIFLYMTFPQIIPPGNTLQIPFIFKPTETGNLNTIVTIESNDPINQQVDLTLTGEAVYEGPHINVPVQSHNYGSKRIYSTSQWFLEIQNYGSEQLEVTDIAIDDTHFYLDENISFPIYVNVLETSEIGIWFSPDDEIIFNAVAEIFHNDVSQNTIQVSLSGSGVVEDYLMGDNLWNYTINAGNDNSPKAITHISDVSGDGIADVIVCSEDNYTRCFNGNSSGQADILWENETGKVYAQNDLTIINDIDDDGYDDVIVGLAWGVRAIKALSGKTGEMIWIYDTHEYGEGGWVYQVWAGYDYNDDGIVDVLASTGDDSGDTGPKRVFCLDGSSGNPIWDAYTGGPNFSVIGVGDFTNDGLNDVVGGGSNNSETEGKVYGINGETGSIEWTFTTDGYSVRALEQLDDINSDGIMDIVAGSSGDYYLLNTADGSILHEGGVVSSSTILRYERLSDINDDGYTDIAVAHSGSNAIVLSGYNGQTIWQTGLVDLCWNIDKIEDISGDGINDIVAGTLFSDNYYYFLDGVNGDILHSLNFGEAVDAICAIPDITGDGSMEMVVGGRQGKLHCLSGGLLSASISSDFVADTTFGHVPFDVQFTDLSEGNVTFWEWDFDNNGTIDSYEQNPAYTYNNAGIYTVVLIVGNGIVSDTATKTDYITVDSTVSIPNISIKPEILIYPNPTNSFTEIIIPLYKPSDISIDIFDMHGAKIIELLTNKNIKPGLNSIFWNGRKSDGQRLKKGIYFCHIRVNNKSTLKKIILY